MPEREVLSLHVCCERSEIVNGKSGRAEMIFFTGEADCPAFRGRILPGGIDTQLSHSGLLTLSARYILEGTDASGRRCRIFIENNGTAGQVDASGALRTVPRILTDSPALQYLETAALSGTIAPEAGGIRISIRTADL